MPIPTKTGIEGFIASDPTLSYTRYGDARFYARVGLPQSTRDEEGNFHQAEPYFTDLVMFGKSAQRAYEQFQKSDNFLAEGQERTYMQTVDGQQQQREQFRAGSIGHNNNMTTYEVDRSRAEERTAERDQARTAPDREPGTAAAGREPADQQPVGADTGADVVAEVVEGREAQSEAAPEGPAAGEAPDASPPKTAVGEATGQTAASEEASPVTEILAEREAAVTPEEATAPASSAEAREPVGR